MTQKQPGHRFSWRAFTSVLLFWTGLVMAVSGIVLFIAPSGRVARAAVWTLWGLDKDGWGAVHTILSFLFTIFAVIHVALNWKPLVSYLKDRVTRTIKLRREWAGATLASILVCALTILAVPPFQSIMDLGDGIKEGWETRLLQGSDILPHTEGFTVEEFAANYRVDPVAVRRALKELGLEEITAETTFGDLAASLNRTPLELYRQVSARVAQPAGDAAAPPPSSGTGRLTVRAVAQRLGISTEMALTRLRDAGIEAGEDSLLKDLGEAAQRTPLDIYRLISGNSGESRATQ